MVYRHHIVGWPGTSRVPGTQTSRFGTEEVWLNQDELFSSHTAPAHSTREGLGFLQFTPPETPRTFWSMSVSPRWAFVWGVHQDLRACLNGVCIDLTCPSTAPACAHPNGVALPVPMASSVPGLLFSPVQQSHLTVVLVYIPLIGNGFEYLLVNL